MLSTDQHATKSDSKRVSIFFNHQVVNKLVYMAYCSIQCNGQLCKFFFPIRLSLKAEEH